MTTGVVSTSLHEDQLKAVSWKSLQGPKWYLCEDPGVLASFGHGPTSPPYYPHSVASAMRGASACLESNAHDNLASTSLVKREVWQVASAMRGAVYAWSQTLTTKGASTVAV